ncbi:MAG: hypothetical protein AAFP68_17820 [Pseudomonadota bacterium]
MLPAIVPYLTVTDARAALELHGEAMGAKTLMILEDEMGVSRAWARACLSPMGS